MEDRRPKRFVERLGLCLPSIFDLPSSIVVRRLPSQFAHPETTKGETGSRRFPPLRQKAYFFFAAFFFPAFFFAFFLAAIVQSPVKE
jgi:hypothetical protein